MSIVLETPRLILRHLTMGDLDDLHRLNSDPDVRKYFPGGVLSYGQTKQLQSLVNGFPNRPELGLWATSNNIGIVELKGEGLLIVSNHRSLVLSCVEEITACVESPAWLAGAKSERTKIFPPGNRTWIPACSKSAWKFINHCMA